jgi:hypothetical protein
VEGSGSDQILRYYPGIILEALRKTTKTLSHDSSSLSLDLNPGPPEYETGVLTATFGDKQHKIENNSTIENIRATTYTYL